MEVKPNAVAAQERVRKASEGRDETRWNDIPGAGQVEVVCPPLRILHVSQPGQVLLPSRMGRIEVTPQAKPDVEVRIFQHRRRQGPPRESRYSLRERELKIEECF